MQMMTQKAARSWNDDGQQGEEEIEGQSSEHG